MRKTHYRDYATEAFRLYARVGGSEVYKMRVWNEAIEKQKQREEYGNGISCPTEAAIIRAEQAVDEASATIADLDAVEYVLQVFPRVNPFTGEGDGAKLKALKMVYFVDAHKELQRGDIQNRVHRASLQIPASEKTIYRWLAQARDMFAEKRGLRIS